MIQVLECYQCEEEIIGVSEWVDTFYGNPRFIGPYCERCVERGSDQ